MVKCQSSQMAELNVRPDGAITVTSGDDVLTYTPYAVTTPDGQRIAHESRGGSLVGVWSAQVGDAFVEVSYLGDGPAGGELVMVVTLPGEPPRVALGALIAPEAPSADVPDSWPAAVDLALGLIADSTLDSGSKDEIESFHQRLLEVVHDL